MNAPIVVAVIDSGWDRTLWSPNVREGIGLVDDDHPLAVRVSVDDHDRNGHGTKCSRLILEHAPNADLIPIRVFGGTLESSVEHICLALRLAKERGARVVSMSLATVSEDAKVPLYTACEDAARRGVLFVAAADRRTRLGYPAVFHDVIGVAAATLPEGTPFAFRANAPIECVARGAVTGSEWNHRRPEGSNSYAAARLTGMIAHWLEARPKSGLDEVREWIASATPSPFSPTPPATPSQAMAT